MNSNIRQPVSLYRRLEHLWERLVTPSDAIQGDEARERSQILAVLLLGLIALALLRALVLGVLIQFPRAFSHLALANTFAVLVALTGLYWLSRRGPHRPIARAAVLITSAAIFIYSMPHDHPNTVNAHIYLILSVLVSSILLPTAETVLLIALHTAIMLLFPLLYDTITWSDIRVVPVTMASSAVLALFHYWLRLERQRQAILQDRMAQTRAMLEAFPDLIFYMDGDGVFLDYEASDNVRLFRKPEEFLGRNVRDVMPPEIAEQIMQRIQRALSTGQVQIAEDKLVMEDHDEWFETRTVPHGPNAVLTFVRNITERHEAANALQHSEETRQALMDALPDLVFRFDRDGTFIDYKAASIGLLLPGEAFLGRNIREMLPEHAEQTLHSIQQALATGETQVFEYQLPYEAEMHTYEARLNATQTGEVVAIVRDITGQRQSQTALHESEARYRALFDDSPISLWEEDFSAVRDYLVELRTSGVDDLATYLYQNPQEVQHCAQLVKILNVNQATLDMLEVEIKETLLASVETLIDKEWYQLFRRELVAFSKGMRHYASETSFPTASGKTCHALLSATIPPGYEGTWKRVYVSVVDITDRKQSEEALATSERQLELAVSGAELGMWDWDLTTNRITTNHWWAAMLGYTPDEIAPGISSWDNALHPDDRERVWAAHHAHLDGFTPVFESEYRMRGKNGNWVWILDRGKVVERDANGMPLRMVGSHLDITERKQSEQDERTQRALAEALRGVAAVLNSTLELDKVLDHILATLGRVVPHDASNIALLEDGVARVVRSRGYAVHGIEEAVHSRAMPVSDYPTLQYMMNTRQPLVIPDTHHNAMWMNLDLTRMMHGYLGAPIAWDDRVVGFIGLQSVAPDFFHADHAERLHAFADHAAIALRNAQWYNAAQRRLAEMEVLHEIMLEITGQLNLGPLLEMLIQHAIKLVNAEAGGIYLYLKDDDVLEWRVSAGLGKIIPIGTRVRRGEGLSGQVWEQNQAQIVNDYPAWEDRLKHLETRSLRAVLAVPIHWQGRLLGVVNAATGKEHHKFEEHDLWLMTLFADQAAIAIQNARLFDAEFQQRALAEALRDTAAAINSTLDLDEILDRLLSAIARVISYDAANILLVDGEWASTAHHRGYDAHGTENYMQHLRVRIDQWPGLHRLVSQGVGFLVTDTHSDPLWQHRDQSAWVRALISVPIRSGDRVIGALNLDCGEPNGFDPQDTESAQAFADQAGIAIENARMYAEIRHRRDDLERRVHERTLDLSVRNAVVETLSSSLDIDEMLDGVLSVVTGQLEIHGSAIYLPDAQRHGLTMSAGHGIAPERLPHRIALPGSANGTFARLEEVLSAVRAGVTDELPAVLPVPIWQQGRIEGLIVLAHQAPRTWTTGEKRMLDAIGRQLGVALANAHSYASAVQGEARIRTILESVTDGLLVFNKDHNLMLMNPAARALFAFYTLSNGDEQQSARLLWDWLQAYPDQQRISFALPTAPLHEEDRLALSATCDIPGCPKETNPMPGWPCWLYPGALPPEEVKQCAFYQQTRKLAIEAQRAPVRNEQGDMLGTLVVLNDVTHYHELDALKGQFVATVSHELRTPLSAILLQISTLLKYYERFDETERHAMIEEIQEQSQILRNLIEDILELSRLDANRSMPKKQWFDFIAAVREVLGGLELTIREKQLEIDTTRCIGSRYIMADPNQIKRVIRNLVGNAVKYTPPGGRVAITVRQEDHHLVAEVVDNGIGISKEHLPHIFERFYRAPGAVNMAPGTGLGLPITKEIAELHGGRIRVQSDPGSGSTFTVYLPIGSLDLLETRQTFTTPP